jgi:hypothetical protein
VSSQPDYAVATRGGGAIRDHNLEHTLFPPD